MPSYAERPSSQLDASSGHPQHCPATGRLCLLSSGSQVRALPGAQVKEVLPTPDKPAEMQNGGAAHHDLLGVTMLGDWVLSSKHGAPRRIADSVLRPDRRFPGESRADHPVPSGPSCGRASSAWR
jgi:hypothetical protein